MRFVIFAALFAVACSSPSGGAGSSSATGSASAPGSSGPAPKLCDKAEQLKRRLDGIDLDASRISVPAGLELPISNEGSAVPIEGAILVAATDDDHISVNGSDVGSVTSAVGEIQTQARSMEAMSRPWSVIVALPKSKKRAGVVIGIAQQLEGKSIYVLATPPGAKLEPQPKELSDPKLDPSERVTKFADLLKRSMQSCPSANTIFQSLGSEDPASRAKTLKARLVQSVVQCDCKVDDSFTDLIASLLGSDPVVVGKRLSLTVDANAKKVKVKEIDGQALYDAIPSDGAPLRPE